MGQRFYDGKGNLVGRQISDAERADNAVAAIILMGMAAVAMAVGTAIAIALAPLAPVLFAGYGVFIGLTESMGWHELFAGVASLATVVVSLWLLCTTKWLRIVYFGAEVLFVAVVAFIFVQDASDGVWAGAASLVISLIGGGIVYYVEKNNLIEEQLANF